MKISRQQGHALATVMLLIILFSLMALTTLRNGLLDFKIGHSFSQQQQHHERHESILQFLDEVIVADLARPGSTLATDLAESERNRVTVPEALLNDFIALYQSDTATVPEISIDLLAIPETTAVVTVYRITITDDDTGWRSVAVYGPDDSSTLSRLSIYRNTI